MAKTYQRPSTITMAGLTEAEYIRAITTLDTPLAIALASRDPRSDFFKLMMQVAVEKDIEHVWLHALYQRWSEDARRENLQERAAQLKEQIIHERELAHTARYSEAILAKPTTKPVVTDKHPSRESFTELLEKLTKQVVTLQEQKSSLNLNKVALTEKIAELGEVILIKSQELHAQQARRAENVVAEFKTHLPVNATGEAMAMTPSLQQKLLKALTPTPLHHVLHYNPGLRQHLHELAATPSETMPSAGKAKCVMDCVASQINVAGALADDENISVKAIFALIKRNQAQLKGIKPADDDIKLCDQIINKDREKEQAHDDLRQIKSQLIQVDEAIQQTKQHIAALQQSDLEVSPSPRSPKPGQ